MHGMHGEYSKKANIRSYQTVENEKDITLVNKIKREEKQFG